MHGAARCIDCERVAVLDCGEDRRMVELEGMDLIGGREIEDVDTAGQSVCDDQSWLGSLYLGGSCFGREVAARPGLAGGRGLARRVRAAPGRYQRGDRR